MSNDFVIYSEPALIRVGMSTDRPTSPMSIREVWIDTDTANGYKAKYESGTGLVWESLASGGGSIQLTDLTDVLTAAYTNGFVLVANGTQYVGRALTESDISDLGSYLTSVDLTTDVTGILPVLNGGTGSSTASGARTNLDAEQTISGRTLPSATVAADDKVIIQDTSGSDSEATVTAQSIADLATSAVTSVFTRAGAIVAATGDYDASQVDNDSTVVGAQVSDALNTLNSGKSDVGHTHLLSAITDAGALASKDFVGYDDLDSDLDSMSGLYNGTTLDPTTMDVTSDGSTVTFSIEKSGGGDVRIKFSDGIHTHDCTPAAELTLTAGTDSVPVQNYIYIDQATLTLSTSTAGWPSSEHAKLGKAFVQSASGVQNRGVLKFHAWSDHTYSSDGGHVQHLNSWIRHQVATWEEGVLCTPTVGSSQLDLSTSIGEVLQLHEHGFPALDTSTDGCFVVNDSAASYSWTDDLSTKLTDASGGSLSAKYYNLVLWGVVSEDAGDCHLMINLPTGSYTTEASAIDDNDNTAVYTIPGDFRGTGFLIARLTVRHQTAGNTFSISQNEDLRGKLPSISAGGTVGGGAEQLSDLTDTGTVTPTDKHTLIGDGSLFQSRALVVADISDAGALAALNTVGSTQIDDSSVTIAKLSATGTASATTYLRGDGAWATPSGSGDVSGVGSSTDNAIARWNGTSGTNIQDSSVTVDDDGVLTVPEEIKIITPLAVDPRLSFKGFNSSQPQYITHYGDGTYKNLEHIFQSGGQYDLAYYSGVDGSFVYNPFELDSGSYLWTFYTDIKIHNGNGSNTKLTLNADSGQFPQLEFNQNNSNYFALRIDQTTHDFKIYNPTIADFPLIIANADGKLTILNNIRMSFGSPAANEILKRDASGDITSGKIDLKNELATLTGVTPAIDDTVVIFDASDSGNQKSASLEDILALNSGGSSASRAILSDRKASGTAGGSASSGWQTRDLNTIVDPDGIVTSLSSNQFVLPAATYKLVNGYVPALAVGRFKAALYNVTDAGIQTDDANGDEILSASFRVATSVVATTSARFPSYTFTIASPKTFEIRMYAQSAKSNNGLGDATIDGTEEVYTSIEIELVG